MLVPIDGKKTQRKSYNDINKFPFCDFPISYNWQCKKYTIRVLKCLNKKYIIPKDYLNHSIQYAYIFCNMLIQKYGSFNHLHSNIHSTNLQSSFKWKNVSFGISKCANKRCIILKGSFNLPIQYAWNCAICNKSFVTWPRKMLYVRNDMFT